MTAKRAAVGLAAVFVVYAALVGWRGVLLIAHGGVVPVLLGLGVLVFPLIGLYVVWRELRFGLATAVPYPPGCGGGGPVGLAGLVRPRHRLRRRRRPPPRPRGHAHRHHPPWLSPVVSVLRR